MTYQGLIWEKLPNEVRREWELWCPCPTCGAESGDWCQDLRWPGRHKALWRPHLDRWLMTKMILMILQESGMLNRSMMREGSSCSIWNFFRDQ